MLEIIKKQYASKKAFTQAKNYTLINRGNYPSHYHDLYPQVLDYYHELNPQFTYNIAKPDLYQLADTFLIRDGAILFCHFLLTNFSLIPKLKTHFLVHKELAKFVPTNLKENFSTWEITQHRKKDLSQIKKVLIIGLASEQYLCSKDELKKKLEIIQTLDDSVEVELHLPTRKNPFEQGWKDNNIHFEYFSAIRDFIGNKKISFLLNTEILEKSDYGQYLSIDLSANKLLLSDPYLDFLVASRGGNVHSLSSQAPKNSVFELDLSLTHSLHIMPFEEKESVFAELLFYKKQTASKDIIFDPLFFDLVEGLLAK